MHGKCCVVGFDVHLEVLFEAVLLEETDDGRYVEVVLVLHRLLRLRLNIEISRESDASRIVYGHVHKAGHVVLFKSHIGVEKRLVAFAAAPENVTLTAKTNGDLDSLLDLRCGKCKNICARRRAGTAHITTVAEAVRRTPEELLIVLLHQVFKNVGDLVKALVGLFESLGFLRDVAVVEAEIINSELIHQLERGDCLVLSLLYGICGIIFLVSRTGSEHVGTFGDHCMPVRHGKTQLLAHGFAADDLVGVIVVECKSVFAVLALIGDFGDTGIKFTHSLSFLSFGGRAAGRVLIIFREL